MAALTKTPSGETLEKVRRLARKMDGNPKLRRAVAAALKAMKLQEARPVPDSRQLLRFNPRSKEAANG